MQSNRWIFVIVLSRLLCTENFERGGPEIMHVDYTGYLVIQGYLMAEVLSINKASASDLLAVGYNCFQGTTHNAMIYIL